MVCPLLVDHLGSGANEIAAPTSRFTQQPLAAKFGVQNERPAMNRKITVALLAVIAAVPGNGIAQIEQPRRSIRVGRADTLLKSLIDQVAKDECPAEVSAIKWRSEWDDVRRDLRLFVLEFQDRVVQVSVDGEQTYRFSDTEAPDVSFVRETKKRPRQDEQPPQRLADLKSRVMSCRTDSSQQTKSFVLSITFVFREDRGLDLGNGVRGMVYEEQVAVDLDARAVADSREAQSQRVSANAKQGTASARNHLRRKCRQR